MLMMFVLVMMMVRLYRTRGYRTVPRPMAVVMLIVVLAQGVDLLLLLRQDRHLRGARQIQNLK